MEPEIFYFHGSTWGSIDNNFTIAGVFSQDTVAKQLILGIALCSENDQFSKKKGRLIAANRALNQKDRCAGRVYITLDDTRAEAIGYPSTPTNTIKTFVGEASRLQEYWSDELKTLFGLDNHKKA